jgi:hypothetical protein
MPLPQKKMPKKLLTINVEDESQDLEEGLDVCLDLSGIKPIILTPSSIQTDILSEGVSSTEFKLTTKLQMIKGEGKFVGVPEEP